MIITYFNIIDYRFGEVNFIDLLYRNHRLWQDVYHVPYQGMLLYVKFTKGTITDFALLSFKEK
ncbi:type II toxin-antitoxin system MqsR family toxin [Mitsuokella multacida]